MKPDIENMYDRLTPRELAAIAFHYYATPGDTERELQQIYDAVPRRDYSGLDLEFKNWDIAFIGFATTWSLLYWQVRCRDMALMGYWLGVQAQKDKTHVIPLIDYALWEIAGQLLALDRVLEDICAEHGIDPADVRWIADTEPYKPIIKSDKLIPNPELREELHAKLSQLFPGHKPAI
ncbi:MAG: hypothetical protein ACYC9J_00440 [Sulfuricaulis sp.]